MCKKLTAERARERIQHLQLWQQQRGLTIREEEYLEALEGYLPVLEGRTVAAPKYQVGDVIEYRSRLKNTKTMSSEIVKVEMRWLAYDEKPFISYGVKHPNMKTPMFVQQHHITGLIKDRPEPCRQECATCSTPAQYESLSVQAALGHGLERYGDKAKTNG